MKAVTHPALRFQSGAAPLIYRKKTVLEKCGISETTLRRWMTTEGFPRPRQLGPRAVGWVAVEIDTWLTARPVADPNAPSDS
ncbi:AlpA family transcriptional regulator [Variovorax sp. EL159]|uniref:helix-turn-helix transcriptional regulator n=1 Tax=Variovorax sp. EL159 TaxID=1566270 RepID=UPI00088BF00B|nr:AlpA family phage regulatory protein [Variovorax sp. EL159]SCX52774.1 transcriptional regulator, AlpA family [Variovorax sp. EL159]